MISKRFYTGQMDALTDTHKVIFCGLDSFFESVVQHHSELVYEDNTLEKQLQKEATDLIREQLTSKAYKILLDSATPLQLKIFEGAIVEGKSYHQLAAEMNLAYFSIYSALWGQKAYTTSCKGKIVGGLFPKVQKKVKRDKEIRQLLVDLRRCYDGCIVTIAKYTE